MPPKRHLRPFHQHPQPIPDSDPETDIPTEPPVLAPPPQNINTGELNLTVLRRYNPSINSIISIAPFAVLYTFSPDSQAWEKCGVEGTLFICHLSDTGTARYNAMILNRKSLENFEAELKSADDVEITEEYVILQAMGDEGTPVIYGIWIFEDGDAEGGRSTREVVAQTILSCAMQAQTAREGIPEADGGVNGHAEEVQDDGYYGMDGTTQMQAQMEEEAAVSQQAGQRLDLLQLFGSKSAALPAVSEPPQQEAAQTTRFTPSADTEFFRSTAVVQQQQTGGPPTQQHTLLDLFKK
ncbi:hypothetical protein LTR56_005192 [Elasticomyces elasticus]|nr:hypothetical protein LTR56_005192 [Elasticomyces elasticus]KAK3659648.1 hypothetical protein LTR22_008379 [Elasticomyces elasticus]KAK4916871.1 hypothetical protein LTR49_015183 [Elasticomyces elasticus]KAK5759638.1 hypothetical protein LTS12_010154 [Elasticomyces elasticus]